MTESTGPARHAAARRRNRSKPVIGAAATVLALWLGLTAPAVSPVAPAPAVAAAAATQPAAPDATQQLAPPTDNQDTTNQPFGFDGGRGGGDRR